MKNIVEVIGNLKGGIRARIGPKTFVVGANECHRAGQLILMYDGRTKPVEEVVVGDRLASPDGPKCVRQLARGEAEMFEVAPTKGDPFVVTGNHLLTLAYCAKSESSYGTPGAVMDVPVYDWLKWSAGKKNVWKLIRSAAHFAADDAAPITLPLEPYLLGIFLGDGALTKGAIVCKADPEIRDYLAEQAPKWGLTLRAKLRMGVLNAWALVAEKGQSNLLVNALREVGVYGLTSGERFVPDAYRRGAFATRLEVLAGLLDTDGYCDPGVSTFDYISQSERLAQDVTFVARSVGLAAYCKPCEKRDQNGQGGTYWRVIIGGPTWIVPTKIARKKATAWSAEGPGRKGGRKNALRTGLSVTALPGTESFFGFTLDGDGRYLLGDFTVTHNSGKTALVNTIEFALTGRVSQVYGRETVADRELLELLAPEGEGLDAEVRFDDGSRITCAMAKGKKPGAPRYYDASGLERPNLPYRIDGVLPIRPLTEAIAGKGDTTRKFFLHFAVGSLSDKDVMDKIAPQLHQRLKQASMAAKTDTPTVDKLLMALEFAEKKVRECSASIKAAADVEQKTGQGLGAPATQEELSSARGEVERLKVAVGHLHQQKGRVLAADSIPGLLAQAGNIRQMALDSLAGAEAKMREVHAASANLPPEPVADGMPREAFLAVLDWHVREGEIDCNTCGTRGVGVGVFAARKNSTQERVQGRVANAANWAQLRGAWQGAEVAAASARAEIAAQDVKIAQLHARAAEVAASGALVEHGLQRAQAELVHAEARVTAMLNTASLWASSNRARDAGVQAAAEKKEWELLVQGCKGAIKDFLVKGQDRIVQGVQMRLPPNDRFLLQLSNSKNKPVFRFGLERDGRLDVALSAGKWAHVLAAVADVCRPQDGFALIVPDDRGFDPRTLVGVLYSLATCNAQVVVHSTTRPESVPAGWTVVDADAGEHRSASIGAPVSPGTAPAQAALNGIG